LRSRVRALLPRLHVLPALSRELDQWAEWLVRGRFEGWPEEELAAAVEKLGERRDRVLDGAAVDSGGTLADVGAGTGLLTLGAVERVGPDGDVVAIDISVDVLEELRSQTTAPNISYLLGSADVLPLPDASVDAVVTRSVLIYVDDKAEAAREFARVLPRGGRASLFEPINSRNLRLTDALDVAALGELGERLRAWNDELCGNPDDPMLNFDESDLERFFTSAGFDVALELEVDEYELPADRYLNQVGAPGRPTVLERWQAAFAPADVERLVDFLADGTVPRRVPCALLTGVKR
jgi:SAM-dependent methyltransferase